LQLEEVAATSVGWGRGTADGGRIKVYSDESTLLSGGCRQFLWMARHWKAEVGSSKFKIAYIM
jgi:hypothetical protein